MRCYPTEERREGDLDVGAHQPRVDGPSVEEVQRSLSSTNAGDSCEGRVEVVRADFPMADQGSPLHALLSTPRVTPLLLLL